MRRLITVMMIPALAALPAACRDQPRGIVKAIVIGGEPRLRDPARGPLAPSDAVLLQNVAQGLVRFDASGNIVGGLAERWNVSDDGMSYIFRLTASTWSDGRKLTAQQVVRALKRQLATSSRNPLKDTLGGVADVVAMTDRVIEIRLLAPRPNLLTLLAQPELAILREGVGTGPFEARPDEMEGAIRLSREIAIGEDEEERREEVLLTGRPVEEAVRSFASGDADLVLGGTFLDLPAVRRVRLARGALRFDPASGLFGLVPTRAGGEFDRPEVRRLLSQAIDRGTFVSALAVPGLAARATVLEPGLDGMPTPVTPAWFASPPAERLAELRAEASRLLGDGERPPLRVALPEGPGPDFLYRLLARDWGALGLKVERASRVVEADFALIDEVAPSSSPAWFVRRFHCGRVPVCDSEADALMDSARQTPIPPQRYALLSQAAARLDDAQLFIPLAAPIRWALVAQRIQGFAGNRYARHTLTDLQQTGGRD